MTDRVLTDLKRVTDCFVVTIVVELAQFYDKFTHVLLLVVPVVDIALLRCSCSGDDRKTHWASCIDQK